MKITPSLFGLFIAVDQKYGYATEAVTAERGIRAEIGDGAVKCDSDEGFRRVYEIVCGG